LVHRDPALSKSFADPPPLNTRAVFKRRSAVHGPRGSLIGAATLTSHQPVHGTWCGLHPGGNWGRLPPGGGFLGLRFLNR